jgi:E3 ubiquitin-protein ligase DOA10
MLCFRPTTDSLFRQQKAGQSPTSGWFEMFIGLTSRPKIVGAASNEDRLPMAQTCIICQEAAGPTQPLFETTSCACKYTFHNTCWSRYLQTTQTPKCLLCRRAIYNAPIRIVHRIIPAEVPPPPPPIVITVRAEAMQPSQLPLPQTQRIFMAIFAAIALAFICAMFYLALRL